MHPTHTPPTGACAEPTPAEILRCAATYIRRHGWHQGDAFAADTDQLFPPACALGAIHAAVTGTATLSLKGSDVASLRGAERVLAAHLHVDLDRLDTDQPFDLIGDWNDEPDRTAAQVVAALHEAAEDWERIHHTGGTR